jgi:phosphopantothenoylcysteine synthetase/decarboxylase
MPKSVLTFLITSGSTKEYIDPVRFISNDSSGKMGAALAKQVLAKKHKVIFVSGQSEYMPPKGAEFVKIVSAADMFNAVKENFDKADIIIGAAAVADFAPAACSKQKIKKGKNTLSEIKLKKNPDIIAYCGKNKKGRVVAGFALETENLIKNARGKLKSKNLDMIIANGREALGAEKTSVSIISKTGGMIEINNLDKNKISGKIINETIRIFANNKAGKKSS